MKTITTLLSLMWSCALWSASDGNDLLGELDRELDLSQHYIEQRQHRIDSLTDLFHHTHEPLARFNVSRTLCNEYSAFQIDSTRAYLEQCMRLAEQMGDSNRVMIVKIRNAWAYMQSGDLIHPLRFMDRLDVSQCPDDIKGRYYSVKVNIYNVLATALSHQETQAVYNQHVAALRDSAFHFRPDDWMLKADVMAGHGQMAAAIDTVMQRLDTPANSAQLGIGYYFLARIYGQMKDTPRQKQFLARSAIADIRNGVREYKALIELAVLLYHEGDTRHAYRYITRSMQDAVACNSRLRMIQIAEYAPVITASYSSQEEHIKRNYRTMLWGSIAFVLVLAVSIFQLVRRNRQLHQARRNIDSANTKLKEANTELAQLNAQLKHTNDELLAANQEHVALLEQLKQADDTKREYVMQFMSLSFDFLNRMETFRSHINKVAQRRNFDELHKAVREGRNIEEEVRMFYDRFDDAFLHIHPAFVTQFNALLRPDEQVTLREGERLNTELRIYALLRLGVTDANRVATFLRCTTTTVYNYRTRMRNRAINRDTFEDDLMHIA